MDQGAERANWARKYAPLWSALLCLLVSAAATWWAGVPTPYIQDEPSYLLAADTFAHGRLTNPTHPMWRHFQTLHVIQQPTYMSKYQPAEGAMLAIGQILTGQPIVGGWLAAALAAGAVTWALRRWLAWKWVLAGTLITLCHPLFTLVWGQSYWGGNVAMMGGALVTGAFRQLWRRPTGQGALALTAGVIVLGFSRPYEGGLFTLMLLVPLLIRYRQRGWYSRFPWKGIGAICAACLVGALGFQAYYNFRITGNALSLPYMVYEKQYNPVPLFVWQSSRQIDAWDAPTMRETYLNDVRDYQRRRSANGFLPELAFKVHGLYADYIGFWAPVLWVPAAGLLLLVRRGRWVRGALAVVLGMWGIVLLSNATMAHYVAPAGALFVYLMVCGLRAISGIRWSGRCVGKWIVGGTLGVYVIMFGVRFKRWPERLATYWPIQRQMIEQALEEREGSQLVLVRYVPTFDPAWEWVFNSANIDGQRIVWAHDLGAEANRKLLEYYKGRQVWLLTVRLGEKKLEPYKE